MNIKLAQLSVGFNKDNFCVMGIWQMVESLPE
jgi:hypothetical protein